MPAVGSVLHPLFDKVFALVKYGLSFGPEILRRRRLISRCVRLFLISLCRFNIVLQGDQVGRVFRFFFRFLDPLVQLLAD